MLLIDADFLRCRLPPEQFEELCLALGMCLECGGSLVSVDGEVVCRKCGRVWGLENVDGSIPFPDGDDDGVEGHFEGHWQPGSSLCFLKGVGDPALENSCGSGLMRVLALAPAKGEDLGVRARRIKVMIQAEDPPQLRKILSRISQLLDGLGFRGNHEIADYAGKLGRRIVAFAIVARVKVPKRWADAIVKYALRKFQLKADLGEQLLNFKDEDLQFIEWFENSIQRFRFENVK